MRPPYLAEIPSRQLVVLLELLGITELPFPLFLPRVITTDDERRRVRDGLKNDLLLRDRARGRVHVRDEIEDAFRLLAKPKVIASVTGSDRHGASWGGVGAARSHYALLAEQDDEHLRLKNIRRTSLAGSTAAILPQAEPGSGRELRYPPTGRRTREHDDAETRLADRLRGGTIHVRGYGDDRDLTWFDCSDGRYCAWTDGGWTTIRPAGTEDIAVHLAATFTHPLQ